MEGEGGYKCQDKVETTTRQPGCDERIERMSDPHDKVTEELAVLRTVRQLETPSYILGLPQPHTTLSLKQPHRRFIWNAEFFPGIRKAAWYTSRIGHAIPRFSIHVNVGQGLLTAWEQAPQEHNVTKSFRGVSWV